MNCEVSKDYMMKYFDGERNDIEEVRFRQHLKNCGKCSEEFNCMAEIFSSLETAGTIQPPEGFEARVMEKVNAVESTRREQSSRMLVLLYNAATVVSIILLMVFVADIRQGGIAAAVGSIREYFGSFGGIMAAVFGVVGDMFVLLFGVVVVILRVFVSIVKTYYYIFVVLAVLLLVVQRLYVLVEAQDGRKS
ncbi:MAG: hypothetical protein FIA99_17070 [Ruminiclostridium sp.]|nr:hypothetical protein [Ruminiclostridium sp.]